MNEPNVISNCPICGNGRVYYDALIGAPTPPNNMWLITLPCCMYCVREEMRRTREPFKPSADTNIAEVILRTFWQSKNWFF